MIKFKDIYFQYQSNYPKTLINFILKKDKNHSLNKKSINDNLKKIIKFEDTSYLNDIFSNENKVHMKEILKEDIKRISFDYNKILLELDSFYEKSFNNASFNQKEITKELNKFDKEFQKYNLPFIYYNISFILDFKRTINNELKLFYEKEKSGEYVDLNEVNKRMNKYFINLKETIKGLEESLSIDIDTYLNNLITRINEEYKIIFENKDNFKITIPNWTKGLLFCLPWIIGFCIFTVYPLIQTFVFSFNYVVPTSDGFRMDGVGFTNYINLFTKDTDFINAIGDYLVEMIIYVPVITVVSLLLALLLNTKVKGTGFFRTIFFLPVIITSGPVLQILMEQGVTSIPGLSEIINLDEISQGLPRFLQTALDIITNEFIVILWFCGIQILVFMTGLQKIDKGVYEAANIDGAGKWEKFWKVTLPAINPTIVINVVFTVVMQSIFALNPIILKIQQDMNDTSGERGYGYSSAMAFTYFLIMIIVLVIFVLIFKSKNKKIKKVGA